MNHPDRLFQIATCFILRVVMLQLAYLRSHTIEMNWRVNPVKASKILKGHDDHVITCLQFCGSKIVSGSDDNTLKVWSVTTGKVCLLGMIFPVSYWFDTIWLIIADVLCFSV